MTQVARKQTVFEPGDMVLDALNSFHLVTYNFLYNRDTAPEPAVNDPFSDNVRRAFLPAGKYRILAYTSSLEEEGPERSSMSGGIGYLFWCTAAK